MLSPLKSLSHSLPASCFARLMTNVLLSFVLHDRRLVMLESTPRGMPHEHFL